MTKVIGNDPTGPGVEGISANGTGVEGVGGGFNPGVAGYTDTGPCVYGESWSDTGTGVYGFNGSMDGIGVEGASPSGVGVLGYSYSGFAGYFDGNVIVTGVINKSATFFKIDHPLDPANKYLFHSGVESPDMKNIYDGVVVLDANGEAIVDLPAWFEALNSEFRYQLTSIGATGPNLYIAEEISDRRFKIAGGTAGMKVCWQVTGNRKDPWAQANPPIVEQEKSAPERDHYLHPEVYGHSQEQSIAWAHHPDVLRRAVEVQQKTRED